MTSRSYSKGVFPPLEDWHSATICHHFLIVWIQLPRSPPRKGHRASYTLRLLHSVTVLLLGSFNASSFMRNVVSMFLGLVGKAAIRTVQMVLYSGARL